MEELEIFEAKLSHKDIKFEEQVSWKKTILVNRDLTRIEFTQFILTNTNATADVSHNAPI